MLGVVGGGWQKSASREKKQTANADEGNRCACEEQEQLLFRCKISGLSLNYDKNNLLNLRIKKENAVDPLKSKKQNFDCVSSNHACLPYKGFDHIYNFRSLGVYSPALKGLIYRSALLDLATEHDIRRLANVYHIKTIIDLRGNPCKISRDISTLKQKKC
eukprot:g1770.t1